MNSSTTTVQAPTPLKALDGAEPGWYTFRFAAMGTRCGLTFQHPGTKADATAFRDAAVARVTRFETLYSRFREDSLVGRINRAAGNEEWTDLEEESVQLFNECDAIVRLTGGLVDPTALPLSRVWNVHAAAGAAGAFPAAAAIAAARDLVGWDKVERNGSRVRLPRAGMGLDFGGLVKEFAVDAVFAIACAAGIENSVVDLGHDQRFQGVPPEGACWRIGVEDPANPKQCVCGIRVNEMAVASSGDCYRHVVIGGRRYGHVLDLRTGWPADSACRAATVLAPSCLRAGALAKAALILGPDAGVEWLDRLEESAGCLIMEDGARIDSLRFPEYLVYYPGCSG